MTAPLLAVEDVRTGYGAVRIIDGLSLAVGEGGVTALVGGNGAGKTTLLRMLAGLLPATAGRICYEGREIAGLSAAARVAAGLVLVPEGRLIFPDLTVAENLAVGAIAPPARPALRASLARVYDLFPRLAERRHQLGGTLSGGEQQMLAIGRALMAKPKLLLMDEPTLGLAPTMAEFVFATMERLCAAGLTILLAEQDTARSLALAGHAFVIENGRIVLSGPGSALLGDPRVRAAYLGIE